MPGLYVSLLLRIKRDREAKAREEEAAKAKEAQGVSASGSNSVSINSTQAVAIKTSTAGASKANRNPKELTAKSKETPTKIKSSNQPPPPGTDEEAKKNALLLRIRKEREKRVDEKGKKAGEGVQNGEVNPATPSIITQRQPGQVFANQPPPPGSGESSQNMAIPISNQFSTPPPPIAIPAQPPPTTIYNVPPPSLTLSKQQPYHALPDLTRPPPAPFSDGTPRKRPHADIVHPLPSSAKKAPAEDASSGMTQLARVKAMVEKAQTPLCHSPYEDQLATKEEGTRQFSGKLRTRITVANGAAETYFFHRESRAGSFVKMSNMVRSPEVDGYRNKCDFAVGINPVGKQLTVGERLKSGVVHVGPVDHLRHISDKMKRVVARVEGFLRQLNLPPHDPSTSRGIWSELSVRLTKTGELMIVLVAHPQSLGESQVTEVKRKLVKFSRDCLQPLENLTSLYLDGGRLEHLWGALNVKEKVGDKLFQISPQSFFPYNVSVVEATCEVVCDLAGLHAESTLVDVCCGTGTIAVYLSDRCGQVLGLDVLPIAIEDARMNALSNDITNGEFHPGGAEEYLGTLWRRAIFNDVICVVDPPPGGIGAKGINHLRKEDRIKKIVFLCPANSGDCMESLVHLTRPPSHVYKGEPFLPERVVPVDTLPHTNNFSIAILLVRVPMRDMANPQSGNISFEEASSAVASSAVMPAPATSANSPWTNVAPSEEERNLSNMQRGWLDQMTAVHGAAFDRKGWVQSMLSAKQPSTPEEWAEYSRLYAQKMNPSQPPPLPPGMPPH